MADSYSKKEREKKRQQKKKEKLLRKEKRQEEGTKEDVIMYVDHMGNFTKNKPESFDLEIDPSEIQTSVPKTESDGLSTGAIKFFNAEKGYGFISQKGKGKDLYFNSSDDVANWPEGTRVKFEIEPSEKGDVAVNVTKVE